MSGNGLSNLHNAKKARTPIVNIVGEHATYHVAYDAPLTADIEGIARPVSGWVSTSADSNSVASDAAEAIAAARPPPRRAAPRAPTASPSRLPAVIVVNGILRVTSPYPLVDFWRLVRAVP